MPESGEKHACVATASRLLSFVKLALDNPAGRLRARSDSNLSHFATHGFLRAVSVRLCVNSSKRKFLSLRACVVAATFSISKSLLIYARARAQYFSYPTRNSPAATSVKVSWQSFATIR